MTIPTIKNGQYSMGAFLVDGKKIVSSGFNSYTKTHPITHQIAPSHIIPTHAEAACIAKFVVKRKQITDDMTLYVTGITRGKNLVKCSKPCASCMSLIKASGIKRVIYYENDIDFVLKEIII